MAESDINQEDNVDSIKKELEEKDNQLKDITEQFNAVKSKADELLGETKKNKEKLREREEMLKKYEQQNPDNYKQLLDSSEKERKQLSEQLENLKSQVSSEKLRAESMKLASEMADGANAEILSEFIVKRMAYADDGVKVLDVNGNMTVSSLSDLKNEFLKNDKFKALLRGTSANGGGASGSGSRAAGKQELTRAQFDELSPQDKMDFIKKVRSSDAQLIDE